jgi:hypothetical protein
VRWVAFLLVVSGLARAAPTVDIKAQTQLQLESVRLRGTGDVEVSGKLTDKLTGDGIGGRTITINIGGQLVEATTEPDGRFTVGVVVPPGPQPVQLKFRGGALLDASELTQVADPSRAPVTLVIRAEDAPGGQQILVSTTVDEVATPLPIDLALGAPGDKDLKPVATIPSNAPFLLTRAAAGGPGSKLVRATFKGNATYQIATGEVRFELTSQTTTTMAVSSTALAFEDDLVATGKVIDEEGKPVAKAAVTLTSGENKVLARGATNDAGMYKFDVEAEILGQGQWGIQVGADPNSSYIKGSRSAPVIIRIAAPQPVPISYTVAAFLATALAAGGFFTARAKPWKRFRKQTPPAEVALETENLDQVDGGLVANKPGLVSTLRRPYDDGFSGVVRDTVRGRPVPEAVVSLVLGDQEQERRTTEDGGFVLEKLAVGDWKAEVAAPGHVTERFMVTIPHRGELRGVRIDLVPVRERVFQLYRRAAEPVLPEARLWGIWSPRQIVDHVRSKRPSPALSELTDFVEEVYFSPRLAAETVLPETSERVDRAIRERARV